MPFSDPLFVSFYFILFLLLHLWFSILSCYSRLKHNDIHVRTILTALPILFSYWFDLFFLSECFIFSYFLFFIEISNPWLSLVISYFQSSSRSRYSSLFVDLIYFFTISILIYLGPSCFLRTLFLSNVRLFF